MAMISAVSTEEYGGRVSHLRMFDSVVMEYVVVSVIFEPSVNIRLYELRHAFESSYNF